MYIYSGDFFHGECGIYTGHEDWKGKSLYTGDIVQLWHCFDHDLDKPKEERCYEPNGSLTAIVLDEDSTPFVMGIKSCGFNDPQWMIEKVKHYNDVVCGEKWKDYGFNYSSMLKGSI